jgi:hypothetical protein
LRYGPYIGERARRSLPSLYARRDEEARFQQELGLQQEQMRLAKKAQRTAQGGAQDANRIALAGLGMTGLLGMKRYEGLNQPAANTAITADAAPTTYQSGGEGGAPSGFGGGEGGAPGTTSGQSGWSQFGEQATSWQPYAAGLGGGLLGSQIGGQIAGRKRRREGKIAGGAIGGGAAGYSAGGVYGGIIGAVVGGGLGALF